MDKYPFSFAQEELFGVEQFFPGTSANNIGGVFAFSEETSYEKINNALNAMIKNFDMFRVRITSSGMLPEQYIEEYTPEEFSFFDFYGNVDGYEKWLLEQKTQCLFANEKPLYRMTILRLPDKRMGFLFLFHHLISDGWSTTNTFNFVSSHIDGLIPDDMSYPSYLDVIESEQKYINSNSFKKDRDFWTEKLSLYSGSAMLNSPRSREEMATTRQEFILSTEESKSILDFCVENEISISTLLTAILAYYKSSITLNQSVSIGTLLHNRNGKKEKQMIGAFARILPIIIDIDEEMTGIEFIKHVNSQSYSSLRHRRYPYQNMLNDNGNVQGLIDIILSFQNTQFDSIFTEKGYSGEWINTSENGVPLGVHINERDNSGRFTFDYDYHEQFMNNDEVVLLHNRILKIINLIIGNPNIKMKNIEIISDKEKYSILNSFNRANGEYPSDKTIIDLFEEQVVRTPNNIAVAFENEQITYDTLNKKANQLAKKLRSLGVKPNDFVAIITERSIEMIVAIYGVLKSGGAYVPIDPTYPSERIKYTIEDCNPKVLLVGEVEQQWTTEVPSISLHDNSVFSGDSRNLEKVNKPNDLIYVIYTSGTTGRPKGVMVEHRNVVSLLVNDESKFDFNDKDTWLMFHSYCFDFSVWEMYGATLFGGRLIVISKEQSQDSGAVLDVIQKEKVTVLNQVPTAFYNLLKYNMDDNKLAIRYLIFGGEALNPAKLNEWHELHKDVKIINMYGITETTVHVTYREIGDAEIEKGLSDIGSAISTLSVYIMNGESLCGIGVPGELCVTGGGVTRGYLNRPELTSEKFIKNPFGEGNMYRSGDLARWLPDGNIEYLGRIDEQVKVRGFRIELGEIESVIRKLDLVQDVAVVVREDSIGEQCICAYIVSNIELDIDLIRKTIQNDLPEYMIPGYMLQIESIPITRNGKLDKNALPQIEFKSKEYISPRDDLERQLVEIFENVLAVSPIGIKDNFFEIGGHSLRAVKLVNQLEAITGVRLPLKSLFLDPTVEGIGRLVRTATQNEYNPIPKAEEKEYYPMSSMQQRLFIINEMESEGVAYNTPAIVTVDGEIDIKKIKWVFDKLIERHEALRTSFHVKNGVPVQLIEENASIEVEFEEITKEFDAEKLLSEFVRPFDLRKPPLLRIKVVRFGESKNAIMFDLHHIIFDGMSINILVNEFSILYNGGELGELAFQYKDYSEWMRTRNLSKQRDYWLNQFSEEVPVLDIPSDFKRPRVQSFEGNTIEMPISDEIRNKILNLSQTTGTTEYMILLSALMVLLHKYSRQEDIVVGSPISGRTHQDTESIIGMFVNTLVMRGKPEKNKPFNDFLEEIKEVCLGAYENQEYPFEELVDEVVSKRDVSRNPLFDVLFVMQNNEKIELQANGLNFKEAVIENKISKFDLSVTIGENEKGYYAANFQYCTNLFKEESIQRMMAHYFQLLSEILEKPEQKIADISIITDCEKEQIFREFNNTNTVYPSDNTLVELFEAQVELTPNNVAVVFENEQITYEEFNKKANQLARKLRGLGVKPNDIVAIMTERSIEMIIGIFAIIKSGAAFVPIDHNLPKDRVRYMFNDCQPKVFLVNKEKMPFETDIPTVNLFNSKSYSGVSTNLDRVNKPSDLVYVLYTSGTTGRPKGVMIEHNALVNRLLWMQRQFPISEEGAILQKTPYSFDVSVWEIVGWSLTGARLCMLGPNDEKDPQKILEAINRYGISTMHFVPSMLDAFLENIENKDQSEKLNSLKQVFCGGEPLKDKHVSKFFELFGRSKKLANLYGPAETTIDVTSYECQSSDLKTFPIGKPIDNIKILILNQNVVVPIGVPGELCILGDGLARGYLNKPELTAEKFVDNPFGKGKMYRSGDLAKWLPDGNIEYLGRIDEQVKIRGLRIELGEIESVIRKIEAVQDVVVIAREDKSGDPCICAYIIAGQEIEATVVRNAIRKELPEYMVPAYIMQIENMPITRNGKLDKKALPEIEVESKEFVAPKNELEKQLVGIFEDVLHVGQVGISDNFFEMGGHSLRAIGVINQIEAVTGVRLPLKSLFENPSVAELSILIEKDAGKEYVPIPNAEEKDFYPMSSVQRRMYVINELDNNGTTYNMPGVIEVAGKIDIEKIHMTFGKLIERHETLRTSFHVINGETVQKIENNIEIEIEFEKITSETTIETLLLNFVRPFNLSIAPLIRLKVVQLSDNKNAILFDMHHIISDGMSVNILANEFSVLYSGGKLEELNVQYKDYSEWSRSRDLGIQKEYWLNQFKEESPVLDLPYDFKRPSVQSFRGNTIETVINKEIKDEIVKLSQKTGTTEYMVLLSAFMVLLQKYSRQEDIVIGSPISGRTHKDTESMLGVFVNTLAMRGKPEKGKYFVDFLSEIKETCLGAYENQEYPFEELVDEVVTKRDVSRNPLFDVLFVMQNNEKVELRTNDLILKELERENTIAKFDLSVAIRESDEGYAVDFEYCSDLFKEESIERMIKHFDQLLSEITFNPNQTIAEMNITTEQEKVQIMQEFNDTKVPYPIDKTLIELFENQVKLTPHKIAIVSGNEQITYEDLNKKANQLARKLRDLGVKSDDFVAIMMERSIEMIIGIYGIMKSGGAYVPIDTGNPEERIRYMLNDCQPKALLAGMDKTQFETEIPTINLFNQEVYSGESGNLELVNKPTNLVYLIYTSGTTGRPKGVMIEHRALVNRLNWMQNRYQFEAEDAILQKTPYTFDVSVWEIMLWSLVGARVCILEPNAEKDPQMILEAINKYGITKMHFVPSMLDAFMNSIGKNGNTEELSSIKKVFCSGEALKVNHVSKFYECFGPDIELINLYGPTEAAIDVSYFDCQDTDAKVIPIGKPIDNIKLLILDSKGIAPIGVPGELCILGDGLARGYLNMPELTAEKFVDNPFGEGKMYRSGDLAKWLPDGNIEYLGRIDEQVKIRGLRIELGEIESVIRKNEGVQEVVVISKEDNNGDPCICAYIVADYEMEMDGIRNNIRKELPEYMIPGYMMQIDYIPVTKNGKLDKKALPQIQLKSRGYIAPRNYIEEQLVTIFEDVLSASPIGINDNFFEMGGHSLKAIKVINRIEAFTGVRLPIISIFENQTIEGLSERIEAESNNEYYPIPKTEEKTQYPMSSVQKRMYVINEIESNGIAYNMPGVLKVDGEISLEKVQHVFEQLIQRHEALRTSFRMHNGEAIQKIEEHVEFTIEHEFVGHSKSIEEILSTFVRPFDLNEAPLLRLKVVQLGGNENMIMIDMHHIISDGMSVNILANEFSVLYNNGVLEELKVQYKDYSEWMRTRDISHQRDYWIEQFNNEIPVLNLPYDFSRPRVQSFNGHSMKMPINKEMKDQIVQLSNRTGTTEYMVLLSAFMLLLHKYSRQEDIIIGSPISGRTHKDTEGMLGMFVNTLAMRGKPKRDKQFKDFLSEIKETCLSAYENQDYPFEELVDEVVTKRDISRNPLFDVLFVVQNNEKMELNANGLVFKEIEFENTISKFDLNIVINEGKEGYLIEFGYCTDLFKAESIERMMNHYHQLLLEVALNPNQKIGDIRVISESEKRQVKEVFNDTTAPYSNDTTVMEMFEKQVQRTPNSIAAIYENEQITYKELNAKANQLAKKLRDLGVKPDDFVALMTERSIEMIVGIYGIIKSGGAYVPIDPDYPKDRIEYILNDCRPKALLTGKPEPIETEIPMIDLSNQEIYAGVSDNLQKVNKPNDLIYLIYTSGTTGRPKGVMVEHKGVMNRIEWMQEKYHIDSNDKILFKTPFTFDVSVWEIFGWSSIGASIVLLKSGEEKNPEEIISLIDQHAVTITHFVPSMFNVFIEHVENMKYVNKLKSLRYILASGEALKPTQVVRFNQVVDFSDKITIINLYGPTEATVEVTYYDCPHSTDEIAGIPIGKPISNTQLYIMDGKNLCGVGMPGELCIAGVGVARGYLNQPEQTAEKFIENPFEKGKMYCTGDLVKWLPDGKIEYLGRMDEQVKIRGYRIELGEIESVIRKFDDLQDVAVVTKEDQSGDKYICAYIVAAYKIDTMEIKNHARKELPEYMIPTSIMQIESIPVTSNGKLDRKALPEIEVKSKEYVAPRNDLERQIAKEFETVLNLDKVGINDSFFEIGGDSIKAIRVVTALSQVMNINIGDIFELQTVKQISEIVTNRQHIQIFNKFNKIKEFLQKENDYVNTEEDDITVQEYEIECNKYETYKPQFIKEKRNVLITGATGYFGIHILFELLNTTKDQVYLIIRAEDKEEAAHRIHAKWKYYFADINFNNFADRVVYLAGNISNENLGLPLEEYLNLSQDIKVIINAAANVNHYEQYENSYATNVRGVMNLIKFAKTNEKKVLHHISTTSVASGNIENERHVIFRESDMDLGQKPVNVYVDTKIQAEKLLLVAREEGVVSNVYRVGNLQCHSKTGVFQDNANQNASFSMVYALLSMKKYPLILRELNFNCVDHVAKACVLLMRDTQLCNETYHLINKNMLNLHTLMQRYQAASFEVEAVMPSEFVDILIQAYQDESMKSNVEQLLLHSGMFSTDTIAETEYVIQLDKTNLILERLGFEWEQLKVETIDLMIENLKRNGIFNTKEYEELNYEFNF